MVYLQLIRSVVCAIKSRIGLTRGLFGGCFGGCLGFIRGTWVGFWGSVFGVGCRNDATKMHNVVGDLLNPMQRYENFLKYANFGEIFLQKSSDTIRHNER